jgi:NTE family protein
MHLNKEISLALGGGGVKGNAHVGVLRILEREGYKIRAIAGTSAGGLWGALYAYGYSLDEIQRRFSQLDPMTLYSRQPEDGPALLGLSGIQSLLEASLGDCVFESLQFPFAVTAVDLNTAEFVVLKSGKVADAVLATIAVPGVFPTVDLDGKTLIDGGVLSPVPVEVARSLAPSLPVVAAVLSPPLDDWSGINKPFLLNSVPILSEYLSRLRVTKALNIFMRSMQISGAMLRELLLQFERPDVIIRPAVPNIGLLEQVDVNEFARLGEIATERVLPELMRAVSFQARIVRMLRGRIKKPIRLPYSSDFPKEQPTDIQWGDSADNPTDKLTDKSSSSFPEISSSDIDENVA